jgi:hypothetical protein
MRLPLGIERPPEHAQVLEMMPHFTERESIVQKTLSKSQADANATMPAKMTLGGGGAEEDATSDSAARPALPTPPGASTMVAPNLLGEDELNTISKPQAADDLFGETQEAAAPPAAPPAAPAVDLLGLMEDAPPPVGSTDVHAAPPGGSSAAPATAPGAGGTSSTHFAALCVQNDGVLHEDATVQV